MIKVVFTYRTKTEHLPALMAKLQASADPKFYSTPTNLGLGISERRLGDETEIVLDIYYASREDYEARTAFERSQAAWNDIWFHPANQHRELSVEVFDVMKTPEI